MNRSRRRALKKKGAKIESATARRSYIAAGAEVAGGIAELGDGASQPVIKLNFVGRWNHGQQERLTMLMSLPMLNELMPLLADVQTQTAESFAKHVKEATGMELESKEQPEDEGATSEKTD